MNPTSSSSGAAPASPVHPAVVQVPVSVEIPANLLPLFNSIKKTYGATDEKVVGDCLRFALLSYQQGMVAPSNNLLDALVNQLAGFNLLRERVVQSIAAAKEACYVSTSLVKALEADIAKQSKPASPTI